MYHSSLEFSEHEDLNIKIKLLKLFYSLYVVPSARLELALQKGTDFKSVVSTNFTTRAFMNFMYVYANTYN